MGKSHPQANRRDTVRSALESSLAFREAASRVAAESAQLEDSRQELVLDLPTGSVAPKWGIAAILGLIGVLGYTVHQRISDGDRSWTKWEKHELTGVVLGQSPDRPATPATKPAASRSSVPPLWSQSGTSRAESARTPRDLGAPAQSEETSIAADDPFAMPQTSPSNPRVESAAQGAAAPRTLFQGEEVRMNAAPIQQNVPRQAAGTSAAKNRLAREAELQAELERDPSEPSTMVNSAGLDFTASPTTATRSERREAANHEAEVQEARVRYQRDSRVQPAGGEIGPPEPVPFGQMPVTTSPAARGTDSLPAASSEPSLDLPTGLPALEIEPTPAMIPSNQNKAAPQQQSFAEPAFPEATPALSMPEPQPQPLENAPNNFRSVDPQFPPQSKSPQTQVPAQQVLESFPNEPVPSAGVPKQTVSLPVAAPPATQTVVQPATVQEEIYQVQSGDNYWTISRRFYGSARFFSALAEYNKHRIPAPEKMKPGMYVLVPVIEVLHQRYPQLTGGGPRDPADSLPPGFFVDANGQPCYRVGKGDTLTDIAQKHLGRSSRWVQIQGLNKDRVIDGRPLKIGTVLKLPSDASQVMLAPADAVIR